MYDIKVNDVERIDEDLFKNTAHELDDSKIYVVKGVNRLYVGLSKGNDRRDIGISSDLLERDLPAASAVHGSRMMANGIEGYWSHTMEGKIDKRDDFSTVYTSPKFLCGGYANPKMAVILEKIRPNQISGFLIKPEGDRYTTIDSEESVEISSALCEMPDILEALGLGELVGREKKPQEYISA
ncbi:MAG: hypothetical protein KAH93_02650 [Candidatus Aenigmarchaeota archaeon]|nr:hypothetical protein [Candidatus Aenigmarchaeota archaeon]